MAGGGVEFGDGLGHEGSAQERDVCLGYRNLKGSASISHVRTQLAAVLHEVGIWALTDSVCANALEV